MRKLLSLGFILLHYFVAAQTKPYIPFPADIISYGYINHGTADNNYYSVYRAEIHGDTIINGLHYSNYYLAEKAPDDPYKNPYPNTSGSFIHLAGAIRNDTASKKVYLYRPGTNAEELLYDFDLHVGDTIFKDRGYGFYHSWVNNYSFFSQDVRIDTAWVSRIDSVFMPHDGLYHRRFNFNISLKYGSFGHSHITTDTVFMNTTVYYRIKIDPLIEGVGVLYNPLRLLTQFESSFELTPQCLSIDGKAAYSNPNVPAPFINPQLCKSVFTGIDEEKHSVSLTVYPNPTSGKFNLVTSNAQKRMFIISNIVGTTILKSIVEKEVTEIDLSLQTPGLYLIQVHNPDGTIITKKLIRY